MREIIKSAPIIVVLFLLNPLVAIVLLALQCVRMDENEESQNNKLMVLFGILCCVFISLVNMTKEPVSDLLMYINRYKDAENCGFVRYLYIAPNVSGGTVMKEPLYYGSVWVLNRLYGGNVGMFLFTVSFVMYGFTIAAIVLFGRAMKIRPFVIIVGIVFFCFYPYIFSSRMNIIRQSLANSVLVYVMVRYFFYGKKLWLGILAFPFLHSSSIFFLPLLFITAFGKPFKEVWYWYVGAFVFLIGIQVLSQYIVGLKMLGQDDSVSYALNRVSGGAVGRYELSSFQIIGDVFLLIYGVIVHSGKLLPMTNSLRRLTFVFLFVSAFILIFINEGQWGVRFFHYLWSFVPFMLMIFLQWWKKVSNLSLFIVSVALIVIWTIYLSFGYWSFDIVLGPWLTPVALYVF